MRTLTIKDLSACHEIDHAAMAAVRGGVDNQANGTSQANAQNMAAAANIGNGSAFCGTTNVQSDNVFTQSASNWNCADDFSGVGIGWCYPQLERAPT